MIAFIPFRRGAKAAHESRLSYGTDPISKRAAPPSARRASLLSCGACRPAFRVSDVYPFTAPEVIPAMKYFWKNRNRIKIGMIEKTAPAIRTS